jgi:methionine-rich copper-binding protein CopC
MATYSVTQGSSTIQISSTAAGFTQNSNPYQYYLNNLGASSASDSFIITFGDGSSIRFTDFNNFTFSSTSVSVAGIPGSPESGFTNSINFIGGVDRNTYFDIYDNLSGLKLLDNYQPQSQFRFDDGYSQPYVFIGYSSGSLTLRSPYHKNDDQSASGVTINSSGTVSFPSNYPPIANRGGASGTSISQYVSGGGANPWVFALTAPDTTAPTLSSSTPADNATAVAIGSNLVLNFSESIIAGTGSIILKKGDSTTIATIPVTDAQVAISGSTITINPTTDLDYSTSYYLEIAGGVFKDAANNPYAGISNPTT